MSTYLETTTRDELEANARKAMARVAAIDVRGWDSAALKADELAIVDALLDAYNALA